MGPRVGQEDEFSNYLSWKENYLVSLEVHIFLSNCLKMCKNMWNANRPMLNSFRSSLE